MRRWVLKGVDVLKDICSMINEYVGIHVEAIAEYLDYGNYDISVFMTHNGRKYKMPAFTSSGDDVLYVLRLISESRDAWMYNNEMAIGRWAFFVGDYQKDKEFIERLSSAQMKVISDSIDRFLADGNDFSSDGLRIKLDMLGVFKPS